MKTLNFKNGLRLLVCLMLGGINSLLAQSIVAQTATPAATLTIQDARGDVPYETLNPITASAPSYQLTLKELGADYPFSLRGVDGSDSVEFTVRSDEFVTDAVLDLRYSYSPALLAQYSHINVLVNDEVAYSIPVPKETAGRSLEKTIHLPSHLISEKNRIRLQLVGHYTLECEDPLHSSLWANISNLSQLNVNTKPVALPNDLGLLPLPFYDEKDVRELRLPFVFRGNIDGNVLEAAGMVASWFGHLSAPRPADFPVDLQANYPLKGSAVVFFIDSSRDARGTTGPTLSIETNPNDPFGKLLYISGQNAQELKQAAQALVLGADIYTGQSVRITQLQNIKPRKPYDAPNWIPTDRPITLGEIAPNKIFSVSGYDPAPIRIEARVAPDLFTWRAKPVSLDLRYRYTPQIGQTNSALLLNTEQNFLRSFPLFSMEQLKERDWIVQFVQGDMLPVESQVHIPLERLVPQTELEFKFLYNYIKEGECRDAIVDNVRGYIDPDSTLDVRGYPHFIEMPNLGVFAQAGFPFTRMADLSETVVALSPKATTEELSVYLSILGKFGAITGYPAVGVQVDMGGLHVEQDKDVLIIAESSQPWLDSLGQSLPALVAGQDRRFAISDLVYKSNQWLEYNNPKQEQTPRVDISYRTDGQQAFFAGLQSPYYSQRSVILLASSNAEGLAQAKEGLLKRPHELMGSLAVVRGNSIDPLVFEPTYSVGSLPLLKRIEWELAKYWPNVPSIHYLLIVLVALIALAFLLWFGKWVSKRRLHQAKET